ncbi:MAG: nickel-binding protein [Dehalococcoidia bacterium]
MPTFQIDRSIAGMTQEELEAGGYRAVSCTKRYSGLAWLRSFVDIEQGRSTCFYEARSREDLVSHQRDAELQWLAITEVQEFTPAAFA